MISIGAMERVAKKVKDLGNEMSTEGLIRPWHIPGVLEGHVYVQSCAHAQERPKSVPIVHAGSWIEVLHK